MSEILFQILSLNKSVEIFEVFSKLKMQFKEGGSLGVFLGNGISFLYVQKALQNTFNLPVEWGLYSNWSQSYGGPNIWGA